MVNFNRPIDYRGALLDELFAAAAPLRHAAPTEYGYAPRAQPGPIEIVMLTSSAGLAPFARMGSTQPAYFPQPRVFAPPQLAERTYLEALAPDARASACSSVIDGEVSQP